MYLRVFLATLFLLQVGITAFAQCPPNIGFESGNFDGWNCYIGQMDRDGLNPTNWGNPIPNGVPGRHTILKNSSPQVLDPIGQFPVNSPNGSKYSLMLGNMQVSGGTTGSGLFGYCERMTYDFVVPSDDFTMVYYYAVVFQNPNHDARQQPKFEANLINLDYPDAVDCGVFSFTASAKLEGFINAGSEIYYKPWSPLTIKISGRKGQRYQLEFISRDCSRGGHYGYAYLDFNEDCASSPITGNNYCAGASDVITLTAPAGFKTYEWKDKDGNVVGNAPTLKLSPAPPDGTPYNLHIVPYPGLGCENDFATTIQKVNEPFVLAIQDSVKGCLGTGVDLTASAITAGSSSDMKYQYYTDPQGQDFLSDPKLVKVAGIYYIRGTNAYGCTDIAKIKVILNDGPQVPPPSVVQVCEPAVVDLTKIVNISNPNLQVSYYSDLAMTVPVPDPKSVNKSGFYTVKVIDPAVSCPSVTSVNLIISSSFTVTPKAAKSCPGLNLTTVVSDGIDVSGLRFHFFKDPEGTIPVNDPSKITESGTYYYNATNQYNCTGNTEKIEVTIYPAPNFTVTNPTPVVFPATVDLGTTHSTLSFANFTYWTDEACTIPLGDYNAVGVSGTFYIKAVSAGGCIEIHPVNVVINPSPEPDLIVSNTFTPNGDGVNDEFRPEGKGVFTINYLKVMNRQGQEVFFTKDLKKRWTGNFNGNALPTATYYWVFSAFDLYRKKDYIRSGYVTIVR